MTKEQPILHVPSYTAITNRPTDEELKQQQTDLMEMLFRSSKRSVSMPIWSSFQDSDVPFYAAFGLINRLEYEFFTNAMNRWQEKVNIDDILSDDDDDDDDDENDSSIINANKRNPLGDKYPSVSNLIKQWSFDTHPDLFLRLQTPLKLIKRLDNALSLEDLRTDHTARISAVDQLLCQAARPQNELDAWIDMNRMVAGRTTPPLKMSMDHTRSALQELNDFKMYEAYADIYEYGRNPVAQQYIKGKLETRVLTDVKARTAAAFEYLEKRGLIDSDKLTATISMSPKEREQRGAALKQSAVSSFLNDIVVTAPTTDWLKRMTHAFAWYFQPILQTIGQPVLSFQNKADAEHHSTDRILHIAFAKKQRC